MTARPRCKSRPHLEILQKTIAQSVQAFSYFLSRTTCQILCACIDLYAGNDAGLSQELEKGYAVVRLLADRLVVEDGATECFRQDKVW
jgi:hypothetical protein